VPLIFSAALTTPLVSYRVPLEQSLPLEGWGESR